MSEDTHTGLEYQVELAEARAGGQAHEFSELLNTRAAEGWEFMESISQPPVQAKRGGHAKVRRLFVFRRAKTGSPPLLTEEVEAAWSEGSDSTS